MTTTVSIDRRGVQIEASKTISLEAEVSDLVAHLPRRPPPVPVQEKPMPPLPDFVQHVDNVPHIGAIAAQAMVQDHDGAAKHIEQVGKELMELAKEVQSAFEKMMAGIGDAINDIDDVAAFYRGEAKRIFELIEHASIKTSKVRKGCADLRGVIAAAVEPPETNIKTETTTTEEPKTAA